MPTGTSSAITFTVTVDGTDYTATSPSLSLLMGSSYGFTLTLNSSFLAVSSFGVASWTPGTGGSLVLDKVVVPVAISFSITKDNGGSTTYQAEKGMTWLQWVESDYCPWNSYIDVAGNDATVKANNMADYVCVKEGGTYYSQCGRDIIIDGTEYYLIDEDDYFDQ